MTDDAAQDLSPETAAAVAAQAAAPQIATFESLIKKPRRTSSFNVYTQGDDGEAVPMRMVFRAIPPKEFDQLVADNQPTESERRKGAVYNVDTFAPALISRVSETPKLTLEQATEIYRSPDWAGGELGDLFMRAQEVCNQGLNVPFNARD